MRLFIIFGIFFSSIAAAPVPQFSIPQKTDTQQILDDLGGVPCFEGSYFTCVTVDIPLNHFDPADTRTIPVVFAVLPASGERKGTFVTATGGPGTSGVLLADCYSAGFDPSIFEAFDVVFFDTFGYGNECPDALVTNFLVNGVVPAKRRTVCEGIVAVPFVPVAPRSTKTLSEPTEAPS